jgi:pyruvate/2-oxoglutarate dehydrogenase complex dihydrolipoamide acyltransferase (E2) component
MTAMTKKSVWGLSASVAALVMFSMGASAQLAPTPAPKAPAAPATAPAPTTKAPAAATPAPKAAAPKAAAASTCKGLDEAGCGAKTGECAWIVPKKVDAKTGKADKAYCRKVAGVAKKAADAKAAVGATPAAPKTAAPAATTPAAPTAPKKN